MILPQALQPVIPRLGARAAEQIVDDEELQVDIAGELEVQVTRPVVGPLDLDAPDRLLGEGQWRETPPGRCRQCRRALRAVDEDGYARSCRARARSAFIHVRALPCPRSSAR